MLLKDKVSIITGGARGIGKAIAMAFAKEGSDIALCDVNAEALEETKKEIEALGRKAFVGVVDVTKIEQVESFVDNVKSELGKIDVLVNNAGVTRDGLMLRMTEADWDLVLNINLKGAFNCTKAVSKIMMKQKEGSIVNMASVIGVMGNAGQANYAASKGGLIALTKSVAKEFASRNIRANAIAPGFITTEMTAKLSDAVQAEMQKRIPLGTMGSVDDVANTALFLASSMSKYITGEVIKVDGGMVNGI